MVDMSKRRSQLTRIVVSVCVVLALIGQADSQSEKPPVVPPKITKLFKPDCSAGHNCHGIRGVVELTVDVLTDGTVGDVTVKSGDPRLTDEAVRAAKLCLFKPGTLLGKPTNMNYDLKYQF
jgi:TonB family protein